MAVDYSTFNKIISSESELVRSVDISSLHSGNSNQYENLTNNGAIFCDRILDVVEKVAPKKSVVSSVFDCRLQYRLCGDKDPVVYASSANFSSYRNKNRAESLIKRDLSNVNFVKKSANDSECCAKKSSLVNAFGANVTAGSVVSIVKLTLDSFVSISYASRI